MVAKCIDFGMFYLIQKANCIKQVVVNNSIKEDKFNTIIVSYQCFLMTFFLI